MLSIVMPWEDVYYEEGSPPIGCVVCRRVGFCTSDWEFIPIQAEVRLTKTSEYGFRVYASDLCVSCTEGSKGNLEAIKVEVDSCLKHQG